MKPVHCGDCLTFSLVPENVSLATLNSIIEFIINFIKHNSKCNQQVNYDVFFMITRLNCSDAQESTVSIENKGECLVHSYSNTLMVGIAHIV